MWRLWLVEMSWHQIQKIFPGLLNICAKFEEIPSTSKDAIGRQTCGAGRYDGAGGPFRENPPICKQTCLAGRVIPCSNLIGWCYYIWCIECRSPLNVYIQWVSHWMCRFNGLATDCTHSIGSSHWMCTFNGLTVECVHSRRPVREIIKCPVSVRASRFYKSLSISYNIIARASKFAG